MQTSYSVENVKLGICEIEYDNTHIGHTQGGATLRIGTLVAEKKVDRYGDVPVDYVDIGTTVEVVTRLAEESLTKLLKILPTGSMSVVADRLTFGRAVGSSLAARRLVLDPIDGSEPIVIYRAVPNPGETIEAEYTNDGQRVWQVTWRGLPVEGRADGDMLFRIGGPAS